jgi:bifunctional DNA-binding transcriptional regulator/antitoxin component of YhaV-PrlF toxin-antitoxin module
MEVRHDAVALIWPNGRVKGLPEVEQGFSPCYGKDKTMAKVTSKYQVTVPRVIADQYGIRPGDEIDWTPAGDVIRVIPAGKRVEPEDRAFRLRLFDQATERQRRRTAGKVKPPRLSQAKPPGPSQGKGDRGWRREDLYARGRSR